MQGHSESVSRAADDRSAAGGRTVLRSRLLAARDAWAGDAALLPPAATRLERFLRETVAQLEPTVLGLYWPQRSEFNAAALFAADAADAADTPATDTGLALALPHAFAATRRLDYRRWDGGVPGARDDHGIPAATGPAVVPDVVLVPCLGYTRDGYRLGYGGGYFDRWLAAHPGVTAVGVAWSIGALEPADFVPEAHDVPMTLVVSDAGVA